MKLNSLFKSWKYPSLLLASLGISGIGEWVYFIALNLIVLNMAGPLAVSGLYILRAMSALFTHSWSGSLIDRWNKKLLMVWLNIIQSVLIAFLPLFSSLWSIYSLVFLICIASSMYHPTSMTYITRLLPSGQRKRFNSFRSLIDSGAFLTGPAVAGLMFMVGSPQYAIYINAIALFVSALITLFMPNIEQIDLTAMSDKKFTFKVLKKDWKLVANFSKKHVYIMGIYLLFSAMMVMTTAVDSLEAAFCKEVLSLSERDYGFLVSIAGGGIAAGAIFNTLIVKKTATSWLLGVGSLLVATGYITYAFSDSFLSAAIGWFILSFAMAFTNTGFYTFYQDNIPTSAMGRIGSLYGLIEDFFIIATTGIFGVLSYFISIQSVVILGTVTMLFITIILCIFSLQPSKKKYYQTELNESSVL